MSEKKRLAIMRALTSYNVAKERKWRIIEKGDLIDVNARFIHSSDFEFFYKYKKLFSISIYSLLPNTLTISIIPE